MPFIAAAAPYMMAAGAALSGVSAIASGVQQSAAARSQADAADYNRNVALQSAAAAREAGEYEVEKQRRQGLRLLSSQRAAFGKAGVTMEGTPLEVMAQTAADLEQEALATRYNYDMQALRYGSQANFYGFEAERQRDLAGYPVTAGIMKAGTTLLTTAGMYGRGMKLAWDPSKQMAKDW